MATFDCAYFCGECQMGFDDETDVRNHLSAEHHNYFPYKCFTCKSGAKHKTVSAEFMYEHTSTAHEGIEPDVRFSFLDFRSKQNVLKLAIQNCRRPSAEQTFLNDSKILVPRVLISSGTTLDRNTAVGNISTSTEMNPEASEFEVNPNNDNMDVRLFMPRENELCAAVENCRRQSAEQVSEYDSKHVLLRDTLTDARDDAIENEVTSTEIKQENDSVEVDNEAVTHSTQLESGFALGNESNLNEYLQENIETNIESIYEIDSLVPPVSCAELPAIVETQQNGVDPITNSENILSLNAVPLAKPESTENVSIVPLRLI